MSKRPASTFIKEALHSTLAWATPLADALSAGRKAWDDLDNETKHNLCLLYKTLSTPLKNVRQWAGDDYAATGKPIPGVTFSTTSKRQLVASPGSLSLLENVLGFTPLDVSSCITLSGSSVVDVILRHNRGMSSQEATDLMYSVLKDFVETKTSNTMRVHE